MNIREDKYKTEELILSTYAQKSVDSKGREIFEEECPVRTCFERDRDRIIHCGSFRRLKDKTQVFIFPNSDNLRTRLTHTLEVSQIARSIARALHMNETLTEAISLGHDLGHTPFGHTGEAALASVMPGFEHNLQSLRIVKTLENGKGLNLTYEVRDGIKNHCTGYTPSTLEGKITNISDKIAYINHDVEDSLRSGVLKKTDIPKKYTELLGSTSSKRINTMVTDVVENSIGKNDIIKSAAIREATDDLRAFLFEHVYLTTDGKREEKKAFDMVVRLFEYYALHPCEMPNEYIKRGEEGEMNVSVADYIAGMTDNYALQTYTKLFLPSTHMMF